MIITTLMQGYIWNNVSAFKCGYPFCIGVNNLNIWRLIYLYNYIIKLKNYKIFLNKISTNYNKFEKIGAFLLVFYQNLLTGGGFDIIN